MEPSRDLPELDRLRAAAAQAMVADRLWAEERLRALAERRARGAPSDRLAQEIARRLEASALEAARRGEAVLRIEYPAELPVCQARERILGVLRSHRAVVLTGETGSGKTTQLPKMLLESGYGRRGMVAITQPRRVAAIAIAERLRDELAAPEALVAHSVRFDDRAGPDTVLRVLTDGLLLAELTGDPLLSRFDAVVVDEAHERSLTIDLLLGLLRRLRLRRPELMVVVSSASIAAERFAEYLGGSLVGDLAGERAAARVAEPVGTSGGEAVGAPAAEPASEHGGQPGGSAAPAPVIAVSGRTFPVEVRWRPPGDEDCGYLGAAVEVLRELHAGEPGDCLCFLPTERDILEAARRLRDLPGAVVLPLFSRLTPGEQQRVFRPHPARKLVLATNIAETSLTIPGIRFVVDTGLVRLKRYQASSRTERLPIEAAAQASCIQRAGRAGRIEAGVCVRLYAEEDFAAREPFVMPEIQRSNLAGVLLTCLDLGIADPERFPWLDPPAPHAWRQARLLLEELGAIGGAPGNTPRDGRDGRDGREGRDGQEGQEGEAQSSSAPQLTGIGRALAAIPADPQVGRILLAGVQEGVPHEACIIAAFLSVQDPRVRPVGLEAKADAAHRVFVHEAGDLATVLNLWERFSAAPSAGARSRLCEASFLGYRRMREWADVRHQLWSSLRQTPHGARLPSHGPAAGAWPLEAVHRAVLAGMLGNVLMYDKTERAYRAAQDRLLHVHPGSALRAGKADDGKRAPAPAPWLVACEVVQTSRLFARLCAPIDPEWVVALAGPRIRRRHHQPQWSAERQQVVCLETITWKGLPVRSGRQVPYERVDPAAATAIFLREALAGEEGSLREDGELAVLAENRATLAQVRTLRDRLRDPSLAVEADWLEAWYRRRLGLPGLEPAGSPAMSPASAAAPAAAAAAAVAARAAASPTLAPGPPGQAAPAAIPAAIADPRAAAALAVIASTTALRRWLQAHGREALRLELSELVGEAAVQRAAQDFPTAVQLGGKRLALTYRFAPGDEDDGATIELGEAELAGVGGTSLDRLVPGWLPAMVAAWLQSLPKDARRALIPLAESAARLAAEVRGDDPALGLAEALRRRLIAQLGGRVPSLDPQLLPPYTRLRLVLRDAQGAIIYQGRDHEQLAMQAVAAPDRLARLRLEWETGPVSGWPGDCPGAVQEGGVRGVVALARCRDAHGGVAARRAVYASEAAAAAWHQDGLLAALEGACAGELEAWAMRPSAAGPQAVIESALGARLGALRRQLGCSALAELVAVPVRTEAHWQELLVQARARLGEIQPVMDRLLPRLAEGVAQLKRLLAQGARSPAALAPTLLAQQALQRLVGPGWPLRRPFASHDGLAELVGAYAGLLEQARTRPDEARRRTTRAQALVEDLDAQLGADAQRWCQALGLMRELRELSGSLESCLAALLAPGSGSGAGWAEERLRRAAQEVARPLDAARRRLRQSRGDLLEARPLAERLPPGRRQRVLQQLDQAIAGLPDLSLGADLDQQVVEAQALLARLRAGSAV